MIANPPSDFEILKMAAEYGASHSQDRHTQNGAAVARRGELIVFAANRFPAGVVPRTERPEKYSYIEHAERAALYTAASIGFRTLGATLYCPWFSCPDCARAIAMSGVSEVVGSAAAASATPPRWHELIRTGERILRESGVGMRWLAGRLGVKVLFDGKILEL